MDHKERSDLEHCKVILGWRRPARAVQGPRIRFSTVAGERGAADAERDIRGVAMKFYTEEGNWDLVGNIQQLYQGR